MKISLKEWLIFIILACLCFGLWYKFSYPDYKFVDLSVDRKGALRAAESYLRSLGVDHGKYIKAIVFGADIWADRYLQKTLGLKSEEGFLKQHRYELFSWQVRFFRELQKEEFVVGVSPRTGSIINFAHAIEDIEPREATQKEACRIRAQEFLEQYGLNVKEYDFHEERTKRYEKRVDYSFSWEKKGVYIPWQKDEGGAKLLIGATVSGNEIRGFYKDKFDIPEKFQRYLDRQLVFGEYLSSLSFVLFTLLVIWSIVIVLQRRHTFAVRLSRQWFIYLGVFFVAIRITHIINDMQSIIISYPTSTQFLPYVSLYLLRLLINLIFLSVAFIMPGLAAESLRSEVMPVHIYSSFLHYIKSTFYSRSLASSIALGYLLFFILLGMQSVIFYFGQKYLGVWREWIKLTQFSSEYLPFLGALVIGTSASISEEIVFRIFGISWGKKYLKNLGLAVIFSSLLWGFGHANYPIFPVWFRGIEVTLMGLLFGWVFIKYGIIALIVAHYLFDVFWGVAAYILAQSQAYLFAGSLFALALPLALGLVAYFLNREEKEREKEIQSLLNPVEKYNLNILITFVSEKKSQGMKRQAIKTELLRNNWDPALVDLAVTGVYKGAAGDD
jgi:membrane protease YdiL (CAAX protease family)